MSDTPGDGVGQYAEPVETLAHRLWTHWSMHIAEEEDISEERLQRWREYWVPYEELDEDVKDVDRRLVERYCEEMPAYNRPVISNSDQEEDE